MKKLRDGAIVIHYTEYTKGKRDYSYYELTDFGVDILKSAVGVLARPYQTIDKLADVDVISSPLQVVGSSAAHL